MSNQSLLAQAKSYIAYARSTELDIQVEPRTVIEDGKPHPISLSTCKVNWAKKGEDRRLRAAYWLECAARDLRRIG